MRRLSTKNMPLYEGIEYQQSVVHLRAPRADPPTGTEQGGALKLLPLGIKIFSKRMEITGINIRQFLIEVKALP